MRFPLGLTLNYLIICTNTLSSKQMKSTANSSIYCSFFFWSFGLLSMIGNGIYMAGVVIGF